MTSFRLFLVSTAPCLAWAFVVGCGSGGGFRGATLTQDDGGGAQSGTSGTAGGGTNAGEAGAGGASSDGAGAGGSTTDAGAGAGGENVGGGQAGVAGASAGALGTGGVAGDASGGASGSSIVAGGGAGGAAGSGATSGIGGETSGGTAGGVMAGSGGMSGAGSGGKAGASCGGSGGSAGSGGPLRTCAERCNADADCRLLGADQGYRCNPSTQRCEGFAEPCRSSLECLPDASFWIFDCTTDADCFFFADDLCVDVGGVGRCARLAPSANGCADPNPDEVTMQRFGATGSALVCANASRTCFEGACVPGCSSNADCIPARNGSVCDVEARLCRCVRDEDCGGIGVSRCNVGTGRCECADSRDCDEVPNANTCTAGRCGCAAVSACNVEPTFSGTSYVCE